METASTQNAQPSPVPSLGSHASGLLKRDLKNRHVQLIALGGAIGTGLFLGSAGVIGLAGPAIILGYVIGGFIEFLVMRQLGEMVVEEPVAGSFSHFAHKYWGNFAGFFSGWNYWMLYVCVSMVELTAVAKYVQWWVPGLPTWVTVLVFFVLINAINLANVRIFGEAEFWFAIIKVAAVIGLIVFGAFLLISGHGGPGARVSNLWAHGGFFAPAGAGGGWGTFTNFCVAIVLIMFSFGGLELVGVSAAETAEPRRTIPKAINQVFFRILIFYVGALAVMLMLQPWPDMVKAISAAGSGHDAYGASPFVLILKQLHIPFAADILNLVVLTAALSVYNSSVYCNSRMLYGLAGKGSAPAVFKKADRRGVPIYALLLSALATGVVVFVNKFLPDRAFQALFSVVVAALVMNWFLISFTHLKFRAAMRVANRELSFRAWGAPVTNWVCIVFVLGILFVMYAWAPPELHMRWSVYAIPVWVALLGMLYFFTHRKNTGVARR